MLLLLLLAGIDHPPLRKPDRFAQHGEIADMVGQNEHQRGIEIGALRVAQSTMRFDDGAATGYILRAMQSMKARVHNGRLVLDEPTELPEGTEVVLAVADDGDDMDDEERARLHESLRRSIAQAKAGQLIDGDEVIGKLLARR